MQISKNTSDVEGANIKINALKLLCFKAFVCDVIPWMLKVSVWTFCGNQ